MELVMNDKDVMDNIIDIILSILIKVIVIVFLVWVMCGNYLHECGMCGARTLETWYAQPDCPVCSKCYDELRYDN